MDESELSKWTKGLLVKIHVITGWVIPDDELMNILIDQFRKKLQESYHNVNVDEIEYAFRTYGTSVKDWGKSMNLSLIDEVMTPYMERRASISKMEEQQPPEPEEPEDLSEKAMQEWYDMTADQVKAETIKLQFIPVMIAEWMINKGKLQDYQKYHQMAAIQIGQELAANAADRDSIRQYNAYKEMYNAGEFWGKWIEQIERYSKQLALRDYIKAKDGL